MCLVGRTLKSCGKLLVSSFRRFFDTVPGVFHTGRHVDTHLVVTIVVFFFSGRGIFFDICLFFT